MKENNTTIEKQIAIERTKSTMKRKESVEEGKFESTIVKALPSVAPEDQIKAEFEMADIVLVSKTKMEKWRRDQEKLKQEMED